MKKFSIHEKGYSHIKDRESQISEIGVLEWFYMDDREHVRQAVKALKKIGIAHLRTGISWADYHTPNGEAWYDWLIPYLSAHFEILPCFLYTPPSLGIVEKISSPPKNTKDYADFLDLIIKRHGSHFEYVELWNEPNNRSEYDYLLDPSWDNFADMIRKAAYWAKQMGKKTVLGGMSPIDPNWLQLMGSKNVLDHIDVIGIHGFPDVFDPHWNDWDDCITQVNEVCDRCAGDKKEVWITETGYSTWKHDERKQVENFLQILHTRATRVYWYSLTDLPGNVPTIDGHLIDAREYHFGMIDEDGNEKLLYRLWSEGGIDNILQNKWITAVSYPQTGRDREHVLITGGAGFIGTNLADHLLENGYPVTVFDNLSRPEVEKNLRWLKAKHAEKLNVVIADIRDIHAVGEAVQHASHIFHFAAQVAVTSSLYNPAYDYEVNVKGTMNFLEAIRKSTHQPSLIFTSTNKVYGNLSDIEVRKNTTRYYPDDKEIEQTGINENRNLDFHSPYGNSKGSADQYVLDYARSFGIRSVVFRMSCIYGPHQHGTEDQGWVAHFILRALKNKSITLFGDGMQVRDILYVDDLINAFLLAWKNINRLKGEAFNIGGGPTNSVSLIELIRMIEKHNHNKIALNRKNWRKGDQLYYVTDTAKFNKATGWKPEVGYKQGVKMLFDWFDQYQAQRQQHPQYSSLLSN
jgi:CDP-paratose 2-epimerase